MILANAFSDLLTTHKDTATAVLNLLTALLAAFTAYNAKKAGEATPDKALIRALDRDRRAHSDSVTTVLKSMERSQRMLERQLDAVTDLLRDQLK